MNEFFRESLLLAAHLLVGLSAIGGVAFLILASAQVVANFFRERRLRRERKRWIDEVTKQINEGR